MTSAATTTAATATAKVTVLEKGGALAIFPQGHRYPGVNPAQTQTKNGAALIAYRSKADIIPVCIKLSGFKYKFLRKKTIIFGRPIKNSELMFENGGNDEYKYATDFIFGRILELGGYNAIPSPESTEEK